MKTIARTALIAIVVAGVFVAPTFAGTGVGAAADEKPLGLVTQATLAQLGDAKAMIGTTVYPGDAVATDQGGLLRLRVGTSQIYLLSSSAAVLSSGTNNLSAKVVRGTVGISTTSSDPVSLELPEGILRPANGEPTYGQVTMVSANEVVITAYSGSLVLDNDGELHTIPAENRLPRDDGSAAVGSFEFGSARSARRGDDEASSTSRGAPPASGIRYSDGGWSRAGCILPVRASDDQPVGAVQSTSQQLNIRSIFLLFDQAAFGFSCAWSLNPPAGSIPLFDPAAGSL